MKRITFTWLVVALLTIKTNVFLYAQIIDYKVFEQVNLDDNIVDISLGTKTEAKAGRPILFNDKLKAVAKKSPNSVKLSKNAEYVAVFSTVTIPARSNMGIGGTGKWEIYHRLSEAKAGEVKVEIIPDVPKNPIILSDVGNFIELQVFKGAPTSELFEGLFLWKKDGSNFNKVTIKYGKSDESWFIERADISSDGQYVVLYVTLKDLQGKGQIGRDDIQFYDTDGKLVWRFHPDISEVTNGFIPRIFISDDGSYVVVSLHGTASKSSATYLLDKRGSVITKISDLSPTHVKFSLSRNHVALLDRGQDRTIFVETRSGKILFDFHSTADHDFDIAERGNVVGIVGTKDIYLLDFNGKKIWSLRFPKALPGPFAKISLSDDGKEMCLTSGNHYSVLQRIP